MKIYIVVEDHDSGPGIASLNICNIFLSKERANEMKESLIKNYDYVCDDEYRKTDEYQRHCDMFRVEEWEVVE